MKNIRILDLGCGEGYRIETLGKSSQYWGVEILSEDVECAKKKYSDGNFVLVNGKTLPFSDNFFDEIHAYDVLEHVEDLDGVLSEINRCLNPNGRFIIEVPAKLSEKILLGLNDKYWEQVGHLRIVDDATIGQIQATYHFALERKMKKKGAENLLLVLSFLLGGKITGQKGGLSNDNPLFRRITYLFSEDFFQTRLFADMKLLWFCFPVWMVTLPIGMIFSQIFPKTIRYELKKQA